MRARTHDSNARSFTARRENQTATPLYRLASFISHFPRSEDARGQAAQGRREAGKGSVHQHVTPRRPTEHTGRRHAIGIAVGVVAVAAGAFLAVTPAAHAAAPAPRLQVHSFANPTSFSAADNAECLAEVQSFVTQSPCDFLQATVTNVGAAATRGAAIRLTDSLPGPLSVVELGSERQAPGQTPVNVTADCNVKAGPLVSCSFPLKLQPDEAIVLRVAVTVGAGAGAGEPITAAVSGGGTPEESVSEPLRLDSPPPFGVAAFESALNGADGLPETLAGAHPYEFRTRLDFDNVIRRTASDTDEPTSVLDPKDVVVDLPPGLIGAATATPYCTLIELESVAGCRPDTRVGQILTEPLSNASANSGIYNVFPEAGVAAEFGFTDGLHNVHLIYASVVPGADGYLVRATTPDAPQIPLADAIVTFFGDPAAKDGAAGDRAMFTDPADCSGPPLTTDAYLDSWQDPGSLDGDGSPNLADPAWALASAQAPPVTGCEELRFEPTITALPSDHRADSPTGLDVDLKVPQPEGFEELATPPLRKAVITLPAGLAVNPSSANGLGACSLGQVGISASGEPNAAPPDCPDSSKLGTVELETPALPSEACRREAGKPQFRNLGECPGATEREAVPLRGSIYLARQGENPFGSLLAIYVVVDDPRTGVVVKLAGEVNADPLSGRLQTVVDDSPQFPFSELRTHFFSGARAPLRTAAVCDTYTATSELTPWSAPQSGPPATPSSRFRVDQAAGGGEECPTSPEDEPNHPAFTAGTVNPQAGAYSTFVVHGARADGDQPITAVDLTLPKGLTGKLAGIPYCPESDLALARSREHEGGGAEELAHPACPAASEVGVARVGAGAGPEPYYVSGHAYLTGPYKGAPLGLAIVTPAVAGPFDLGDVVVRAALNVDPLTTQISAVSDPIPTILHGIPLDIRSIALEMSRHEFTLNPTNCEKTQVSGEAVGQFGTNASLFEPFQVTGCRALGFRPKLAISLKGSTRHAGHPALKAVLTYPKQGAYANVARAQVNLPHSEFIDQANLNKTCTRPVLLAGACPASTVYGRAKAWTPLLGAPLEGNVYLVGGFGYKLPALVAELGGQIRVLLVGKVDSGPNKGIRNTFEAVPDAPVEKFVLEMKGGPRYSLLENSEDLCIRPQKAIAAFTAQNGATLRLTPKIANGCGKKKAVRKKTRKSSKKGGH
jgi:hypothetical protein